jgi:hypothetical protein
MGHLQARQLPKKPPKKKKKAENADDEPDEEEEEEEEEEDEEEEAEEGAAAAAPRSAVMQLAQVSYWCDYIESLDLVAPQQHTKITPLRRRRALEQYACARLQLAMVDARLALSHGRKTFETAITVPVSMEQLCSTTLIAALESMRLVDRTVCLFYSVLGGSCVSESDVSCDAESHCVFSEFIAGVTGAATVRIAERVADDRLNAIRITRTRRCSAGM